MKSAILRFRIMAIICGVLSLILWFFYMPAKYGFHLERTQPNIIWITQIHGALYIFYVLSGAAAQRSNEEEHQRLDLDGPSRHATCGFLYLGAQSC